MNYLLDTNHLSPIITIHHPLRFKILDHRQRNDRFFVPTPVLSEFLFGLRGLPRLSQNLQEWENLKNDFNYYSIQPSIAEDAALLRSNLRQKGRQLGLVDAFCAVIALRDNLTFLTADTDFHAIPALRQENWLI